MTNARPNSVGTGAVEMPGRRHKRTDPRRQNESAGPQFCGRCDHSHAVFAAAGVEIVCPGPDDQRQPVLIIACGTRRAYVSGPGAVEVLTALGVALIPDEFDEGTYVVPVGAHARVAWTAKRLGYRAITTQVMR